LHDIGWHYGATKHHRRAYDLIKADGLSGFTPTQVEQISLVARYHRKAPPKLRHQAFAQLNALDRQMVTRLAAILRVADGLDRSHRAAVQDVTVQLTARRARLCVTPRFDDVEAELWAAGRKKKLLETVLGRTVILSIQTDRAEPGPLS
jgi:exopolyphosphatase/guanosine-5'-triphosphate,3'-diphosphate pyrophosphatase